MLDLVINPVEQRAMGSVCHWCRGAGEVDEASVRRYHMKREGTKMMMSSTRIAHGGLMRCCVQTIVEHVEANPTMDATDGVTLPCKFGTGEPHSEVILDNGVWRWHTEKFGLPKPGTAGVMRAIGFKEEWID